LTSTFMTASEIQITPDNGNNCDNISTTANLSNGQFIAIYVPDLEKAQILLGNNTSSDLSAPQSLFYLALLGELRQIPNFNISNAELTKVFTNSWRNSMLANDHVIRQHCLNIPMAVSIPYSEKDMRHKPFIETHSSTKPIEGCRLTLLKIPTKLIHNL
ncbi:13927_t:CDS:2, partial [Entrophospora sp. SA101]